MAKKRKGLLEGKTIEIGGIVYKVIYRPRIIIGKKIAARGSINFDKRILELEHNMSPSEEIQVIIHELTHGTLDVIIPANFLDELGNLEEMIVDPFSRIFTGALRSAGLLRE